jgi:DNA-binding CsgD family transcriptional regulator
MQKHYVDETTQLSTLIGKIYDAALDPGLWQAAVGDACHFIDCTYGVIGSMDLLRSELNFNVTWGYDPRDWQNYLDNYMNKNPINPMAFRAKAGDILSRADSPADWKRLVESEFYREWAQPLGIVDVVQGTLDKTASGIAMLSCARHESAGPAGTVEIRRMHLMLPHFRRAMLISTALDLRTLQAAAFAETIDALATGVFLVSPQGDLVHANASGLTMLEAGDPLKLVDGHLVASDGGVQGSLRRAFAASIEGATSIAGGMALPLISTTGGRFVAHVLPLTSGARRVAGTFYSAAAALFVREARVDIAAAINAAAQLYGLTPTEERVLRAVIEVGGIVPAASILGTSKSTVKTHLEHLFKKTGTNRQADLVKLISGFESPARLARTA